MIESPDRTEPPFDLEGERPMLEGWLDYHRATLAVKCSDLSAKQLRTRAVPPSDLSLLGLLRHMADVERFWFGMILTGARLSKIYAAEGRSRVSFADIETQDPKEAFEIWQAECEGARSAAASIPSLDDEAKDSPPWMEKPSLRWIILHMIDEYARHNGHADFLRECIDGKTGD